MNEKETEQYSNAFQRWWNEEGSAMRPLPNEDQEEYAHRIAAIAWSNGAYTVISQNRQQP